MKLKVGMIYVMRNGKHTQAIKKFGDEDKYYQFWDGEKSWTPNGKYIDGERESQFDIVSEYVEPAAEIDLTAIDKPLGQLDVPTAIALFLHWRRGGVLQNLSRGGKWFEVCYPSWSPCKTFRAAPPPPPQPMVVPWDALDPSIKWVAATENGKVYGFSKKPMRLRMWWSSNGGDYTILTGIVNIKRGTALWSDTLQPRPGHEEEERK